MCNFWGGADLYSIYLELNEELNTASWIIWRLYFNLEWKSQFWLSRINVPDMFRQYRHLANPLKPAALTSIDLRLLTSLSIPYFLSVCSPVKYKGSFLLMYRCPCLCVCLRGAEANTECPPLPFPFLYLLGQAVTEHKAHCFSYMGWQDIPPHLSVAFHPDGGVISLLH